MISLFIKLCQLHKTYYLSHKCEVSNLVRHNRIDPQIGNLAHFYLKCLLVQYAIKV